MVMATSLAVAVVMLSSVVLGVGVDVGVSRGEEMPSTHTRQRVWPGREILARSEKLPAFNHFPTPRLDTCHCDIFAPKLPQTAGARVRVPSPAMNTSQPVSSTITGIDFGFLSPEDVRTLSVKRITSSTTFDSLLHPVPGGLHDAALGAFLDNP
jgi:hypothetical protein